MNEGQFTTNLLDWFDKNGRKDLPWNSPRTAYGVWISEIMLQQTQVKTVIPYFNRFMLRFPDIASLAAASEDELLSYWSGLGYYSRARNIQLTAKILFKKYQNQFPELISEIIELPGIGPSTAAAICSQAFNQPTAILDANVKRVLCRHFLIDGFPEESAMKKKLWLIADRCMAKTRCADYTQAIMDFGAICCTNTKPQCSNCPLSTSCLAYKNQLVQQYPKKKIKKIKPIKSEFFLLLFNADKQIYLEKRPPTGIWGGLWSLPSTDSKEDPRNFLMKTYQLNCNEINPIMAFKHSFTHFHLEIEAFSVYITDIAKTLPGKWYRESELKTIGIPTPVSRIILSNLA